MKDFRQWVSDKKGVDLDEAGKRTALSPNYPSLYHSIRQQPRQTWTPISATAPLADKQIKDDKVKNGGPNITSKKDNPYKDFYKAEWESFLNKKIAQVQGMNEMSNKKKGSQPVTMPNDKNGPMKISLGPVAIGHQGHIGGTGAYKNKKQFNKSDRGASNRKAIQQSH